MNAACSVFFSHHFFFSSPEYSVSFWFILSPLPLFLMYYLIFLNIFLNTKEEEYFIVPCGKFGSPYLGKAHQLQEQCYPVLSVCAVFPCVQTRVWLPVSGIVNMCTDVDACNCTRGLYGHCRRVCTGRQISCHTEYSNSGQYCIWLFSQKLYQLSYPCSHTDSTWIKYGRHMNTAYSVCFSGWFFFLFFPSVGLEFIIPPLLLFFTCCFQIIVSPYLYQWIKKKKRQLLSGGAPESLLFRYLIRSRYIDLCSYCNIYRLLFLLWPVFSSETC